MSEIDTSAEAIAAIMEGVTPPPWCAGAHRWPEQVGCCPLVGRPFSAHRHLRNVAAANTEADIRFIAAARELVPALAAERDALRAEVERLREAVTACESALVESKREMWIGARDAWTMEDFKNWAVIQQIQSAIDRARAALKGGANG